MWVQRFGRYRSAMKLDKDDGARQVDALLYAMGDKSEAVFQSLTFESRRSRKLRPSDCQTY